MKIKFSLDILIIIFISIIIFFLIAETISVALASGSSVGTSTGSTASINSSSLSIAKLNNGNDLTILSIDSLPNALNSNSDLSQFVIYMFYFLFAGGIIFSLWEGYRLELTGGSFNYYGLFIKTGLIAIGFLSWKSIGISNFAQDILTLADRIQLFILKQNVTDIGQTVSQTVSSITKSLSAVSIPTVSSNGTAYVQKGWNLNPISWFSGALHAITGTILMGILWFIFNLIYVGLQLLMALAQLVLLGLLFAICPIMLGFESIPYTSGVLGKWFKMFIEISFWGVLAGLEQLIFFTMLGKIGSINIPSSGTGAGQFLGIFTFAEQFVIFLVMILIPISVPFFIGKIFNGLGDMYHTSFKKVMTNASKTVSKVTLAKTTTN